MTDENPPEETPEEPTPEVAPVPERAPGQPSGAARFIEEVKEYSDDRSRKVYEHTVICSDLEAVEVGHVRFRGKAYLRFQDGLPNPNAEIQFDLVADTLVGAFEVYEDAASAAAQPVARARAKQAKEIQEAQQRVQVAPASALEGIPGPEGLDLTGR